MSNNCDTSDDWDWSEEVQVSIKPLTAKQRFEQVLLQQRVKEFQFKANPLYDSTTPQETPIDDQVNEESTTEFEEDYANWKPFDPDTAYGAGMEKIEHSEEYEVQSDSDYVYENISDSDDTTTDWDTEDNDTWKPRALCSSDRPNMNQLQQELRNLKADLAKVEERSNILLAEKEMIAAQLEDCEDAYDRLIDEMEQLEDDIDAKENEIAQHQTIVCKLQALREKQEKEESIIEQLVDDVDEYSQATQMLLNHGLYFDMEDLIRKHLQKCDSSDIEKIKRSIISEANIIRDQQVKSAVETLHSYLKPHK